MGWSWKKALGIGCLAAFAAFGSLACSSAGGDGDETDQAIQQRLTELQTKMSAGPLDVADKYELMTLLQAQRRRGKQPADA